MARVHHYRIDGSGGNAHPDSAQHGGSIFDLAANGLDHLGEGIGNLASGIFG
ncbi:unnamed protein product [Larinioides sclopetarius]